MSWDNHLDQLEHEGLFSNEYLMTRRTQEKLVSIVAPYLQRAQYNSRCSEPILVEHIVAVRVRVRGSILEYPILGKLLLNFSERVTLCGQCIMLNGRRESLLLPMQH